MQSAKIGVLAVCLLLAGGTRDTEPAPAREAAPAPAIRTVASPQSLMKAMVGTWKGTCSVWLQPGKLHDKSDVQGTIEAILPGRVLRHHYTGEIKGKPRKGEETITFNRIERKWQVSWCDSWHMNYGLLWSEGTKGDGKITVSANYRMSTSAPYWKWKTVYEMPDEDHLTITAYNYLPDGRGGKAVETIYERVKSGGK